MAPQTLQPPPAPEIAQQASPEQAASVFAQQGLDQPQDGGLQQQVEAIMVKMAEANNWAGDMKNLVGTYDPSLMPYLEQVAKTLVQFANAVQEKAQRSGIARGSSVVPPTPPQNPAAPPPNPNQM